MLYHNIFPINAILLIYYNHFVSMRTFILILALAFLVCSTPGAFTPVDTSDLLTLSNNDIYKSAEAKAREVFQEKNNSNLGSVIAVQQQIVSGINYKITFESSDGSYDVVVYCQPWTNTVKVLDIQKH